jgi:hypothetical protein
MIKIDFCYSKLYDKLPQCKICDHFTTCRDSRYIRQSLIQGLDVDYGVYDFKIEETEEKTAIADILQIIRHSVEVMSEFGGESLKVFLDFYILLGRVLRVSKTLFDIVMVKIINPEYTYNQIASDLNITFDTVRYHLKKGFKEVPELKEFILIDKRHWSKKKLQELKRAS